MEVQGDEEKIKISWGMFRDLIRNSNRLLALVWREKRKETILLLLVFIVVSVMPFINSGALALLLNNLIESAGQNAVTTGLLLTLVLFAASNVITPVFIALQNYLEKIFWFFLGERFEMLILDKKGEMDVANHENPRHNDLIHTIRENGVGRIQNFVDRQFFVFQNIIEVIVASVIIISFKWWIFVIIALGIIPELIIEMKYGRDIWGIWNAKAEVRRRFWDLRRHFDWLPSLIELKIAQNIGHFRKRIHDLLKSFHEEEKAAERRKTKFILGGLLLSYSVLIFAVVWFVLEVVHGVILVGTLTFVLSSVQGLRRSLSSFFSNLGRQYQDALFVNDVFRFLNIEPVLLTANKLSKINPGKTPEIIFENVSFSYPGTEREVIKNLNLRIGPGERLAIVGANGSGKTTLVKLLCRFYDPSSGSIKIDGYDLREVDLESWYKVLSVLFQDYTNYHFTVKEAIAVGDTSIPLSMNKIVKAAEASEADAFIKEWEKGYDQMLGKEFHGGIQPSIGQGQKLALARTFYREPHVLILDEPTSSIDAESEAKIFDKLEELPEDRTIILISHRFSTVRHASKIIVMDGGRIKEEGTHRELLKKNRIYARFFKIQAKGYK